MNEEAWDLSSIDIILKEDRSFSVLFCSVLFTAVRCIFVVSAVLLRVLRSSRRPYNVR